ncbi:MAG: ankyrin repeat domain-containing protein [Nitrospirota bacterium]|nr:ankyrin repeat domain-containing protein [Nitrospirota bacterium]
MKARKLIILLLVAAILWLPGKAIAGTASAVSPKTEAKQAYVQAAADGDIQKVQEYLAAKGPVDAKATFRVATQSCSDCTALMAAAAAGRPDMVMLLLKAGASATMISADDGAPAFAYAISGGSTEVIDRFLASGISVKDRLNLKAGAMTPAEIAFVMKKTGALSHLVKKGGEKLDFSGRFLGGLIVEQVVDSKQEREVVEMLRAVRGQGFSVNEQEPKMLLAILEGDRDLLRNQLKGGGMDMKGPAAGLALALAVAGGESEMTEDLLGAGADADARIVIKTDREEEITPLLVAAFNGDEMIAARLIEKGADVNGKGMDGFTPLLAASFVGSGPLMQLLIEKGADVNAADGSGKTALTQYLWNATSRQLRIDAAVLRIVELLLAKGADVNAVPKEEQAALQVAVLSKDMKLVRLLLDRGADVNLRSSNGRTALGMAVALGDIDMVKFLVKRGGDLQTRNEIGTGLLHAAVYRGRPEIARYLRSHGVTAELEAAEGSDLLDAVINGKKMEVKALLNKNAAVNAGVTGVVLKGYTPLMIAAAAGDTGIAKALLAKGADVEIATASSDRALLMAARGGNDKIVKLLLEKGAKGKDAALEQAAMRGRASTVRLLVKQGAKEGIPAALAVAAGSSRLGSTAAPKDYLAIVQFLLENGADPNGKDGEALLNAAGAGAVDIIRLLLERKARVRAGNAAVWTALTSAADGGSTEAAELLLQAGAPVNEARKSGETALTIAAAAGNEELVRLLLKHGADTRLKAANGFTALKTAKRNGKHRIAKILREAGATE